MPHTINTIYFSMLLNHSLLNTLINTDYTIQCPLIMCLDTSRSGCKENIFSLLYLQYIWPSTLECMPNLYHSRLPGIGQNSERLIKLCEMILVIDMKLVDRFCIRFNPLRAGPESSPCNIVKIMVADALAPCVARASAPTRLIMEEK